MVYHHSAFFHCRFCPQNLHYKPRPRCCSTFFLLRRCKAILTDKALETELCLCLPGQETKDESRSLFLQYNLHLRELYLEHQQPSLEKKCMLRWLGTKSSTSQTPGFIRGRKASDLQLLLWFISVFMDSPAQFTSLAIIEILILELIWCSFRRMNINIFLM